MFSIFGALYSFFSGAKIVKTAISNEESNKKSMELARQNGSRVYHTASGDTMDFYGHRASAVRNGSSYQIIDSRTGEVLCTPSVHYWINRNQKMIDAGFTIVPAITNPEFRVYRNYNKESYYYKSIVDGTKYQIACYNRVSFYYDYKNYKVGDVTDGFKLWCVKNWQTKEFWTWIRYSGGDFHTVIRNSRERLNEEIETYKNLFHLSPMCSHILGNGGVTQANAREIELEPEDFELILQYEQLFNKNDE